MQLITFVLFLTSQKCFIFVKCKNVVDSVSFVHFSMILDIVHCKKESVNDKFVD